MKLSIKTAKEIIEIDVDENMTIGELKQKLFDEHGIQIVSQKLTLFNDDGVLQDEAKLSEFGEVTKSEEIELNVIPEELQTPVREAREYPQPQTGDRDASPMKFSPYQHRNLFTERRGNGPVEISLDDDETASADNGLG